MSATPITALHSAPYGLTFHKTAPLRRAGHTTVDQVAELVAAYRANLDASPLVNITGMGPARITAVCEAIDRWVAEHVVPWSELPQMSRVLAVGIDYGTTNATSALMLGEGIDRCLYLLDEWRHDPAHAQARLTDAQLSAGIRGWLDTEHHPTQHGIRPQWIVADPAAASFRVQLHQDGTVTQAADNDVAYGIRVVSSLLGAQRLKVSDRCRGWITEAPGYSWDDKATEDGTDKPVKTADHSLDAGRYAIATTESLWRRTIAV